MAILVKLRNKMRNNPYTWDVLAFQPPHLEKWKNTKQQLDITLESIENAKTRHLHLSVKSDNRTDLWLQKHPEGNSARQCSC